MRGDFSCGLVDYQSFLYVGRNFGRLMRLLFDLRNWVLMEIPSGAGPVMHVAILQGIYIRI